MAGPLLNRRDVTAARDRQLAGPEPEGSVRDQLAELLHALREQNRLTREQIEGHRADINELCVTDREPAQAAMENFPLPGARRLIVRRAGNGGSYPLSAASPLLVCAANEGRLGGLLTVSGATGVSLYLTTDLLEPGSGTPLAVGAPQIWVPPGGSWDFQLSDMTWCGNVVAYATAATTVLVAEV